MGIWHIAVVTLSLSTKSLSESGWLWRAGLEPLHVLQIAFVLVDVFRSDNLKAVRVEDFLKDR
jgi:hypothetical protein